MSASDYRFSDVELHHAVGAYGLDSMCGQLAAHCLELRMSLELVINSFRRFAPPSTENATAIECAIDLLRKRS